MKLFNIAAFVFVLTSFAVAEDSSPTLSVEGVRIVGGDMGLTWGGLKLIAGGGWEAYDVGRDLKTGEPLPVSMKPGSLTLVNGVFRLRQSFKFDEVSVWAGPGVLWHGDLGLGKPATGFLADQRGGLFALAQLGVTRDARAVNEHGVLSGSFLEAFAEAGPAFLSMRGTDYYKLSFASSLFVPLWDLPGESQLFSGLLALRANAQWINGATVPFLLLEPTEVRGYVRLLDTRVRSVGTAELRLGLPSLLGKADLIPVVFAFADTGVYAGYADAPSAVSDRRGWLAAVGGGLGMTVFGATTPTLSIGLPLIEESALWWKINFNLRF